MPRFIMGTSELDIGFAPLEGELAVMDRQLAWELYTQLLTRVAIRGKVDSRGGDTFRGEVLAEGFDEIEAFADAARGIMARFPVGQLDRSATGHLGTFIARSLELVIRPFLEKWQSEYRSWWEVNKINGAPFVVQRNFPTIDELLDDWSVLRRFFRATLAELSATYGFADVVSELTPEVQGAWYHG